MAPIIKWAGGKRRLLPQLLPLLPETVEGAYIEPFFGSGALFFAKAATWTQEPRVILNDSNRALVEMYLAVRQNHALVSRWLAHYAAAHESRECYNELRDTFNSDKRLQPARRAALFLFLNRTCFNGVWRVNRAGQFNVPAGKYAKLTYPQPAALSEAAHWLRYAQLLSDDFVAATRPYLHKGAFVYLDPPYVPVSATANFTSYTVDGFDAEDFGRLVALCNEIDQRGAKFMLSNSDSPLVLRAFSRNRRFNTTEVTRNGTISSDTSKRGQVGELVIRNYT